jgi:hypothetical protein
MERSSDLTLFVSACVTTEAVTVVMRLLVDRRAVGETPVDFRVESELLLASPASQRLSAARSTDALAR